MRIRFSARCERVRPNNGIVEVLFTRRIRFEDSQDQEEHVLINVHKSLNQFEEGRHYWIDIQPAFPHP